mmetsp:Transcript_11695/g.35644  ORF Transcript_11695/g.35644 Transcript_11695/m.35644 type:complete len:111 (+) Transcript_11695:142-474(+)
MSTPSNRVPAPRPPERGSFPLDHFGECAEIAKAYKQCLKETNNVPLKCRQFARKYLECRMETGLMAKENWQSLGFREQDTEHSASEPEPEVPKEKTGYVAGLQRARGNRR